MSMTKLDVGIIQLSAGAWLLGVGSGIAIEWAFSGRVLIPSPVMFGAFPSIALSIVIMVIGEKNIRGNGK